MLEIVPMAEEHINGGVTLEEATFSIPWTRADFEREVRENTMAIYYVALMDGRVVGYAGMWHVVTEGHITNVGVLEEVRCEGIGSRLMDAAEHADTVFLGVGLHSGYGSAQRMYIKRGYIPDGSGVWYRDAVCAPYADCRNDDDLVLYLSKKLR